MNESINESMPVQRVSSAPKHHHSMSTDGELSKRTKKQPWVTWPLQSPFSNSWVKQQYNNHEL